MKYFATIGDNEYEVEISGETITLNGEEVNVNIQQSGVPELYSLLMDGMSVELLIEPDASKVPSSPASTMDYTVGLRGERFDVLVEDERTRRLSAGRRGPSAPQGDLGVKAPIPGMVVKILVQADEEVEEGQPLAILEAMKMENEIRAPRAGTVKQIDVGPGDRVDQGAVLLVLG
jgi:biotin carboxyl carrier protein